MSNQKALELLAEVVATRELESEAYDLHCRIEEFISQPAAGEPVAYGPSLGQLEREFERYCGSATIQRDASEYYSVPLYAAPPAAAHGDEAVRNIESAAMVLAARMDYPWDHMPEQGRNEMRRHARAIIDAAMRAQGDGGEA